MRIKKLAILWATLIGVTGCASQVPVAENFPISMQNKVRASHHWDVIADDVATQTRQSVEAQNYLQGRPLFVQPATQENTAFNKAFRNFMITRLVNRGLPVSTSKIGAVEVQYEAQIVKHQSDRSQYRPGALTALAAGILVARNLAVADHSTDLVSGALLGAAALADVAEGFVTGGATKTELIVTTSILSDGRFVMRKTDVYYLEDVDASLFEEMKVKEWKVVGQ